jgi:hypothetical protein
MDECKSGQCNIHGGSHEEMSGGCGCGCGCSSDCSCGCGTGCSCSCCGHGGEDGHEKCKELLFLAKTAHMELLKQKMKTAIEAKIGKKMDKVADLVVDTALAYMKHDMAKKTAHADFDEKLMEIFKTN